jgi:large subunit ribosomal protein L10
MTEGYTTKVRPEKVEAVDVIKSQIGDTQAVVLTEYRGLTVNELAELRSKLGEQETSYKVVKNTLARRAVVDLGLADLEGLFVGPVAVAYCKGDPVAAARVLATFAREHPDLVIKGGVLEGRIISADEAKALSTVDTLDVSRAKIAGLLTAPLRQLMMLLEAPTSRIIYVLEQLGSKAPEQPAEQAPEAPVAEEAPTAEEPPAPAEEQADVAEQAEEETKEGE